LDGLEADRLKNDDFLGLFSVCTLKKRHHTEPKKGLQFVAKIETLFRFLTIIGILKESRETKYL
jgi:hypothetical protein